MPEPTVGPMQSAVPPQAQLAEIGLGLWRTRAITIAAELELADHLASGSLHLDELASRTKTHASSLFRLLRALESIGVFEQTSPRVFGNTPMSNCLRKSVPGSSWAIIRSLFSVGEGEYEAWAGLLDTIQTGRIAFDQIHGCNFWEFLRRNPERAAIFNESMRSASSLGTPVITAACDWSRFPVIADIGGGIGTQLIDILNAHASCRGILFDRPDVLAQAIPHDRVRCVAGSFLESVPSGADAYILRSTIHDWADRESVAILKNVRTAMKPDSRVILIERIVSETPEPDLTKWLDLHMLVVAGGQERTAAEYTELYREAGLEVERIVPTRSPFKLIFGRRHQA
jgi:hypothetical protein